VAEALLGPLGDDGGLEELGTLKSRAVGDANSGGRQGAAARAAYQACRRLENVAQRRKSALASLAQLETRKFRSFDDGDSAKKRAFFEAQAQRQWEDYANATRPRIQRALATVRAAER
jgi:hypothetical protein